MIPITIEFLVFVRIKITAQNGHIKLMCGIAGKLVFNNQSIEMDNLKAMNVCLAHRGPDRGDIWLSEDRKIGLAHRRLSIVDLSDSASQPMTNEDGNIIISFNGEIYNHIDLKKELLKSGHTFKTDHADTEVIIHGYEEWGYDVLNRLDGMFAFAIWEHRLGKLFLARDRIGIKPLYYYNKKGALIFASEIKAILKDEMVKIDYCKEALFHYLTFVSAPAPLTMFKDIFKLPAGHYMTADCKANVHINKYYDPIVAGPHRVLSFEDAKEELMKLLRNSIKKRMMSDVPFGAFLSGGVDSSTNVALMSELMSNPAETFSVGFKADYQEPHNEFQYARKVAGIFKTNHHEILIDDRDFLELFNRLSYLQDEPIADPVCVPLYYVSKLAKECGVTVVQVGEGADELLCGYDRWVSLFNIYKRYWRYFKRLPFCLKKIIYDQSKTFLNDTKVEYIRRALNDEEMFWSGAVFMNETIKKNFLSKGLFENMNSHDIVKRNLIDLYSTKNPGILERMAYIDLKHRLPDMLLMRVDKMTMANSIEARVPFLDHKLVEFLLSLPDNYKTNGKTGKLILKKAVESILPKEIIYRKKMAFCGGTGNMMTDEIYNFAKDLVLHKTKDFKHIFIREELESLFKTNSEDKRHYMWSLMNLALWWKKWIN